MSALFSLMWGVIGFVWMIAGKPFFRMRCLLFNLRSIFWSSRNGSNQKRFRKNYYC